MCMCVSVYVCVCVCVCWEEECVTCVQHLDGRRCLRGSVLTDRPRVLTGGETKGGDEERGGEALEVVKCVIALSVKSSFPLGPSALGKGVCLFCQQYRT